MVARALHEESTQLLAPGPEGTKAYRETIGAQVGDNESGQGPQPQGSPGKHHLLEGVLHFSKFLIPSQIPRG